MAYRVNMDQSLGLCLIHFSKLWYRLMGKAKPEFFQRKVGIKSGEYNLITDSYIF